MHPDEYPEPTITRPGRAAAAGILRHAATSLSDRVSNSTETAKNLVRLGPVTLSQLIRSRPGRFFGTIDSCGPDWAVNRLDRKLT